MYFHLVYSAEFFSGTSRRKLTDNVFCEATELMVTMDHELVGNSTSPHFAFLSCPFHIGISLPLGRRLTKVIWAMEKCQKPNFFSYANANFVYL